MISVEMVKFDVYIAPGMGLFWIRHNLEGNITREVHLKRNIETYDAQKEHRNEGREMELGAGYSVP